MEAQLSNVQFLLTDSYDCQFAVMFVWGQSNWNFSVSSFGIPNGVVDKELSLSRKKFSKSRLNVIRI